MKYYDYNTRFDELRTLTATPAKDRHSLKVTDLEIGSFIKIDGTLYKVMDEYLYQHKKETWTEYKLMSIVDESIRFIEIEIDDDVEVFLTDDEIKLKSLNMTKGDLDYIWEEDDFDNIEYAGRIFEYEDCYKAKFKRSTDEEYQKCQMYEFESTIGKKQYITIEDWDGEIQVFVSSKLSNGRVEIASI